MARSRSSSSKTRARAGNDHDKVQLGDRTPRPARARNWKQPLKELSENTGGFAVLDSNDYRSPWSAWPPTSVASTRSPTRPSVAAWDGALPQHRGRGEPRRDEGAAPATATSPRRPTSPARSSPTSCRCSRPCRRAEPKKDFPITAGTFAFGSSPEGREITLVARAPDRELQGDDRPEGEALQAPLRAPRRWSRTRRARPWSGSARTTRSRARSTSCRSCSRATSSSSGSSWCPPGPTPLELVAQDRESAATSVHRVPLVVAPAEGLAMSSVVIVRRMEPAPAVQPGAPEDPLRGEAMRIVPSLDDPISKAATAEAAGLRDRLPGGGGRRAADDPGVLAPTGSRRDATPWCCPQPTPTGASASSRRSRSTKYAPGRHELKVTVRQGSAQAEEKVAFTLQP